jgi:hypothetical protein
MYRGEAVFFGKFEDGAWKFGLKDLNMAAGNIFIAFREDSNHG